MSQTLIQSNCSIIQIFCSVPFYNNCLKSFSISCLFYGGITISAIFLEFPSGSGTDFFHNFFSNFISCQVSYCLSCFMDYSFGSSFCSSIQSFSPIFVGQISHKKQESLFFDVFSSSWLYRIMCHVHLLITIVKLILSSISKGLPF